MSMVIKSISATVIKLINKSYCKCANDFYCKRWKKINPIDVVGDIGTNDICNA